MDYLTTLIHLGFSHKPCIITVFMLYFLKPVLVYSPVVRVVPYGVIDRGVWLPLVKKPFVVFWLFEKVWLLPDVGIQTFIEPRNA